MKKCAKATPKCPTMFTHQGAQNPPGRKLGVKAAALLCTPRNCGWRGSCFPRAKKTQPKKPKQNKIKKQSSEMLYKTEVRLLWTDSPSRRSHYFWKAHLDPMLGICLGVACLLVSDKEEHNLKASDHRSPGRCVWVCDDEAMQEREWK